MNKKTFGIASASVVAISLVAMLGIGILQPHETSYNPGLIPPAESIMKIVGGRQVPDAQEAANSVGYPVKLPAYLPKDYKVQFVGVDNNIGQTTILVSKKSVTTETNNIDFTWRDGGVWITLQKADPSFNKEEYITRLTSEFEYSPVKINAAEGAFHEILSQVQDGETVHAPAELVFYKNDIQVYMRAMLPSEELIRIAETL